jgi:hypothetical protein
MTWYHRARQGPAIWLGPLLLLPALAGCGQPTGHISGKVIYQGRPLTGGRLVFRPADPGQNTVPALVAADGSYEATLPVGDVTIAVDNRELQPHEPSPPGPRPGLPEGIKLPGQGGAAKAAAEAPNAAGGRLAGKYVPIPEKFYQAETSGLKYTVKKGNETYDIELK